MEVLAASLLRRLSLNGSNGSSEQGQQQQELRLQQEQQQQQPEEQGNAMAARPPLHAQESAASQNRCGRRKSTLECLALLEEGMLTQCFCSDCSSSSLQPGNISSNRKDLLSSSAESICSKDALSSSSGSSSGSPWCSERSDSRPTHRYSRCSGEREWQQNSRERPRHNASSSRDAGAASFSPFCSSSRSNWSGLLRLNSFTDDCCRSTAARGSSWRKGGARKGGSTSRRSSTAGRSGRRQSSSVSSSSTSGRENAGASSKGNRLLPHMSSTKTRRSRRSRDAALCRNSRSRTVTGSSGSAVFCTEEKFLSAAADVVKGRQREGAAAEPAPGRVRARRWSSRVASAVAGRLPLHLQGVLALAARAGAAGRAAANEGTTTVADRPAAATADARGAGAAANGDAAAAGETAAVAAEGNATGVCGDAGKKSIFSPQSPPYFPNKTAFCPAYSSSRFSCWTASSEGEPAAEERQQVPPERRAERTSRLPAAARTAVSSLRPEWRSLGYWPAVPSETAAGTPARAAPLAECPAVGAAAATLEGRADATARLLPAAAHPPPSQRQQQETRRMQNTWYTGDHHPGRWQQQEQLKAPQKSAVQQQEELPEEEQEGEGKRDGKQAQVPVERQQEHKMQQQKEERQRHAQQQRGQEEKAQQDFDMCEGEQTSDRGRGGSAEAARGKAEGAATAAGAAAAAAGAASNEFAEQSTPSFTKASGMQEAAAAAVPLQPAFQVAQTLATEVPLRAAAAAALASLSSVAGSVGAAASTKPFPPHDTPSSSSSSLTSGADAAAARAHAAATRGGRAEKEKQICGRSDVIPAAAGAALDGGECETTRPDKKAERAPAPATAATTHAARGPVAVEDHSETAEDMRRQEQQLEEQLSSRPSSQSGNSRESLRYQRSSSWKPSWSGSNSREGVCSGERARRGVAAAEESGENFRAQGCLGNSSSSFFLRRQRSEDYLRCCSAGPGAAATPPWSCWCCYCAAAAAASSASRAPAAAPHGQPPHPLPQHHHRCHSETQQQQHAFQARLLQQQLLFQQQHMVGQHHRVPHQQQEQQFRGWESDCSWASQKSLSRGRREGEGDGRDTLKASGGCGGSAFLPATGQRLQAQTLPRSAGAQQLLPGSPPLGKGEEEEDAATAEELPPARLFVERDVLLQAADGSPQQRQQDDEEDGSEEGSDGEESGVSNRSRLQSLTSGRLFGCRGEGGAAGAAATGEESGRISAAAASSPVAAAAASSPVAAAASASLSCHAGGRAAAFRRTLTRSLTPTSLGGGGGGGGTAAAVAAGAASSPLPLCGVTAAAVAPHLDAAGGLVAAPSTAEAGDSVLLRRDSTGLWAADAWAAPESGAADFKRIAAGRGKSSVLNTPQFCLAVTVVVLLDAVKMGVSTYFYPSNKTAFVVFLALEVAISAFFAMEAALKLRVLGLRSYFFSVVNCFDFFLLLVELTAVLLRLIITLDPAGVGKPIFFPATVPRTDSIVNEFTLSRLHVALLALDTLQLFRLYRLTFSCKELFLLTKSVLHSLRSLQWTALFVFCVIYACAVFCTWTFYDADDAEMSLLWGNLVLSMFTLFTVLTLEGWNGVANSTAEKHPFSRIFFVCFICFTTLTLLNIVTGIILDAYVDMSSRLAAEASYHDRLERDARNEDLLTRAFRQTDFLFFLPSAAAAAATTAAASKVAAATLPAAARSSLSAAGRCCCWWVDDSLAAAAYSGTAAGGAEAAETEAGTAAAAAASNAELAATGGPGKERAYATAGGALQLQQLRALSTAASSSSPPSSLSMSVCPTKKELTLLQQQQCNEQPQQQLTKKKMHQQQRRRESRTAEDAVEGRFLLRQEPSLHAATSASCRACCCSSARCCSSFGLRSSGEQHPPYRTTAPPSLHVADPHARCHAPFLLDSSTAAAAAADWEAVVDAGKQQQQHQQGEPSIAETEEGGQTCACAVQHVKCYTTEEGGEDDFGTAEMRLSDFSAAGEGRGGGCDAGEVGRPAAAAGIRAAAGRGTAEGGRACGAAADTCPAVGAAWDPATWGAVAAAAERTGRQLFKHGRCSRSSDSLLQETEQCSGRGEGLWGDAAAAAGVEKKAQQRRHVAAGKGPAAAGEQRKAPASHSFRGCSGTAEQEAGLMCAAAAAAGSSSTAGSEEEAAAAQAAAAAARAGHGKDVSQGYYVEKGDGGAAEEGRNTMPTHASLAAGEKKGLGLAGVGGCSVAAIAEGAETTRTHGICKNCTRQRQDVSQTAEKKEEDKRQQELLYTSRGGRRAGFSLWRATGCAVTQQPKARTFLKLHDEDAAVEEEEEEERRRKEVEPAEFSSRQKEVACLKLAHLHPLDILQHPAVLDALEKAGIPLFQAFDVLNIYYTRGVEYVTVKEFAESCSRVCGTSTGRQLLQMQVYLYQKLNKVEMRSHRLYRALQQQLQQQQFWVPTGSCCSRSVWTGGPAGCCCSTVTTTSTFRSSKTGSESSPGFAGIAAAPPPSPGLLPHQQRQLYHPPLHHHHLPQSSPACQPTSSCISMCGAGSYSFHNVCSSSSYSSRTLDRSTTKNLPFRWEQQTLRGGGYTPSDVRSEPPVW